MRPQRYEISQWPEANETFSLRKRLSSVNFAHQTCASFIELFDAGGKLKKGNVLQSEQRQDLLRAMLVFASSGLDATIKELINDALPVVIDAKKGENGSALNFATYVEKHLLRDQKVAAGILARAITSQSPRADIMRWFQGQLSAESLQSKDQVFQIASYFDIPTSDLCDDVREFAEVFKMRNRIIHEMDVDFKEATRSRRTRNRDDIVAAVNLLLETSEKFLHQVDRRCNE